MSTPYHENTHDGVPRNNIASENLSFFCQLVLILGLHVSFPLLDSVHTLIEFAQCCDVLMCDFINVVKIFQLEFYQLYNDSHNQFDDLTFDEQNVLETFTNKNLLMSF